MELLDFYVNEQCGQKWIPQDFTDEYVYMRCEHYGHLYFGVFKIRNKEIVFPQPVRTFANGSQALKWMRENSESRPQQFLPSAVKEALR